MPNKEVVLMHIMNKRAEIRLVNNIYEQTLKLISLYKLHDLSIPFTLKGNLGEFIVRAELLRRFPKNDIQFHGGAFPGADIIVDNLKIQVKTQIKHPPKIFKNGFFDFESCPTIKKSHLANGMCDILILVILYPDDNFACILKNNIYIFDRHDFKYFNPRLCWSGKSKGDYTIVNVLKVEGCPPKKLKENIAHYDTSKYRTLFKTSKDNWGKITRYLT